MQSLKIPKKRAKRISKRLKKFLRKNGFDNIYNALKQSSNSNNYFDFSHTHAGKISYLKRSRMPDKLHKLYNSKYRISFGTHAKMGKLLDNAELFNNDLVRFSEVIFSYQAKLNVSITNKICEYYHEDNNWEGGLLSNSCMRHDNLQTAIRFYENIGSDTVRLAVIYREDKIIARALLWLKVELENGEVITYLDRVYATDTLIECAMNDWAEAKGYRTYKQGLKGNAIVRIPHSPRIHSGVPLPYTDTFRSISEDMRTISRYGEDYELESTEGYCIDDIAGEDRYSCCSCGSSMHEDDRCYSERYQETYCTECVRYSDYESDYILRSDARYSEVEDTYFHYDNEDFIQDVNSDWILFDNAIYDEETSEYYNKDDYAELITEREDKENEENE